MQPVKLAGIGSFSEEADDGESPPRSPDDIDVDAAVDGNCKDDEGTGSLSTDNRFESIKFLTITSNRVEVGIDTGFIYECNDDDDDEPCLEDYLFKRSSSLTLGELSPVVIAGIN